MKISKIIFLSQTVAKIVYSSRKIVKYIAFISKPVKMRDIFATKQWKIANCNPFFVWVERLRDVTRGILHLVVLQRS